MQYINRVVQVITAHTVPPPHPAVVFSTHVKPGLQRFFTHGDGLPRLADLSSAAAFRTYYATTDPLQSALALFTLFTTTTYIVSELTGNVSQVDRLWALLPLIFSAHFTFQPSFSATKRAAAKFIPGASNRFFTFLPAAVDERMALILFLQIIWSLRLNLNTVRRGFYDLTTEDYRWPIIRRNMPTFLWKIFNLTFVAITQNALLASAGLLQYLLLTAHTDVHPTYPYPALGWPDFLIAGLFIGTLAIEQLADEQQQAFQSFKHAELKRRERGKSTGRLSAKQEGALKRGFVTSGLWAWSRHPNFLCEQSTWWILYLFSLRVTVPQGVWHSLRTAIANAIERRTLVGLDSIFERAVPHFINYSIVTAIGMNIIFIGSTPLTERISSDKYPLYKRYQTRVAMFFPLETLLVKIPWVTLTGRKKAIDADVFGDPKLIEGGKKTQ